MSERITEALGYLGTGSVVLGGLAAAGALVALAVAHRRDLSSSALSLLGAASVVLVSDPAPTALALMVASALGTGAALVRGARCGVARPSLLGVALAIGGVMLSARAALPSYAPAALDSASGFLVIPGLTMAPVLFVLALERPAPRRSRRQWYRRVPVE